jgi:single-stranded-DNA-specific exonuclease
MRQTQTPATPLRWQLPSIDRVPEPYLAAVRACGALEGELLSQLLWQRGIPEADLAAFLKPEFYSPTGPAAFGEEMTGAIARLLQAQRQQERLAIWGDFDADGVTATAVLWEGLRPIFPAPDQLQIHIPNRLRESHGLHGAGLKALAQQRVTLVVTCDTGSTSLAELALAQDLGLAVIVTDHHTLPEQRPPVVAMLNPRSFPAEHPLATLSGVAVAYKLVEGLYQRVGSEDLPPLSALLELVAIGLVADLVELRGESRYLVQQGLRQLQQSQDLAQRRPGVHELLSLCKRSGDRPGDIAFGIGPRLNAISRISGDAQLAVELLTSRDSQRCKQLALQVEQLNQQRRSLQTDLRAQVQTHINGLDLSTTPVLVLADYGWPVGLLGLVASQVAQEYARPTVLLSLETTAADQDLPLARGSARSIQGLDLYTLLASQRYLLTSFGGHPLSAGLSLPLAHLDLFREGLTAHCRRLAADLLPPSPELSIDAEVTLAALTPQTCQEVLKLLEPCGMGNPTPKFLVRNLHLESVSNTAQEGGRRRFPVTNLRCRQGEARLPGIWWGHWPSELPPGPCDAVVELDWQPSVGVRLRLVDLRPAAQPDFSQTALPHLLDWRQGPPTDRETEAVQVIDQPPLGWQDLKQRVHQAESPVGQGVSGAAARAGATDVAGCWSMALGYAPWPPTSAALIWRQWLGWLKTMVNSGIAMAPEQIRTQLQLEAPLLELLLAQLSLLGFGLQRTEAGLMLVGPATGPTPEQLQTAWLSWQRTCQEYTFRRTYFDAVPLQVVAAKLTP